MRSHKHTQKHTHKHNQKNTFKHSPHNPNHKLKHSSHKLKHNKQLFGGAINSDYITLLSQFPHDDFGIYINPIYGLMASKSLIPTFYNLGHNVADDDNAFYNILHILFNANGIVVEPSKSDCFATIQPIHIGYIVGQLYISNIHKTPADNKASNKKTQRKSKTPSASAAASNKSLKLTTLANNTSTATPTLPAANNTSTATPTLPAANNTSTATPTLPAANNNYKPINTDEAKTYFKKIKDKLGKYKKSTDIKLFHSILAFLWMRFNSILDLQQYFIGLQTSLPHTPHYQDIHHSIRQTLHNIHSNTHQPNKTIVIIKTLYNDSIRIISYTTAYINNSGIKIDFSDCFETTLRNLFNYFVFTIGVNLDTANPDLQNYYRTYDDITLHETDTTRPYTFSTAHYNLNSRDAWALIVSNLPPTTNIQYKRQQGDYHYEIYSRIDNFQNILSHLFNTPFDTLLTTLNDLYNIAITLNSEQIYGDILINRAGKHVATLHIDQGHAYFLPNTNNHIDFELSNYDDKPCLQPYLFYNTTQPNIQPYDENIYKIHNLFYMNPDTNTFLYNNKYHQPIKISNSIIQFYTNYFIYILKTLNADTQQRYFKICNITLLNIPAIYESDIDPNKYKHFMEFTVSGKGKYKLNILYVIHNPKNFIYNPFLHSVQITHLILGNEFNQTLEPGVLPISLTHLTFGNGFNQTLAPGVLPISLTHLTFGESYNKLLEPGVLPISLTHLTFGNEFNQTLEPGVLPISLTYLTFGESYNKLLEPYFLPQSLTHLTFGNEFNQTLEPGVLPISLTYLTFGESYNKLLVPYVLPQSLTHLTFGTRFNQPLEPDVLPQSLTHITFGNYFDQQLNKYVLPQSLTYLTFGTYFNQLLVPHVLPPSLTHLTFGYYFNKTIEPHVLPSSITHLVFGTRFNKSLVSGVLPSSLTHLILGIEFNQQIDKDVLPSLLTHLTFGDNFNQQLVPGILPPSITHLTFGAYFNQRLEPGVLPSSITHLIFGWKFNQQLEQGLLPLSLTHLTFGEVFDQQLDKDVLPPHLISLSLPKKYTHKIEGLKNSSIIKYY
jgi:hypothetical protein